jgi:hypothetical protein
MRNGKWQLTSFRSILDNIESVAVFIALLVLAVAALDGTGAIWTSVKSQIDSGQRRALADSLIPKLSDSVSEVEITGHRKLLHA